MVIFKRILCHPFKGLGKFVNVFSFLSQYSCFSFVCLRVMFLILNCTFSFSLQVSFILKKKDKSRTSC